MSTETTNGATQMNKQLPKGAGAPNAKRAVRAVNPFERNPAYVPGKPGFEKGVTLAGTYVGTQVARSNKLTTSKRDLQGNKYRLIHTFRTDDAKAMAFDIWSVGQLDVTVPRLAVGQYCAITYLGRADKPLRAGESPSHEFKLEVEGELGPVIGMSALLARLDGTELDVSDEAAAE
jgi:hypothetical protein